MATVRIGSGLAGFPGFPILPLGALTDPASIPPAVLYHVWTAPGVQGCFTQDG